MRFYGLADFERQEVVEFYAARHPRSGRLSRRSPMRPERLTTLVAVELGGGEPAIEILRAPVLERPWCSNQDWCL